MIGGANLSLGLLGVARHRVTGALKFLILDPHYEELSYKPKALSDKGFAWRDAAVVFQRDCTYNLLLPQRPKVV